VIILLLTTFLLLGAIPLVQAESYNPLYANLDGDMLVSTEGTAMYTLTVIGGPAEDGNGNYTYEAEITGSSVSDAEIDDSSGESADSGIFTFNVTAPSVAQTFYIVVNCTSYNDDVTLYSNITFKVIAVEPVVITATITNNGEVSATGVPLVLQLYESGDWVTLYNTTMDLDAGGSYDFSYNWTVENLESGEYRFRLVLDENNTVVTFEGGGSVYEKTVYYDVSGYDWMNTMFWVLIIALAIVTFFIWIRPDKKKKK
jgi:hypothetical protein